MLVSRNIKVNGRRTSMRLERSTWEALEEIAKREGCTLNKICEQIDSVKKINGLSTSTRIFVLAYYRNLAVTSRKAKLIPSVLGSFRKYEEQEEMLIGS